MRLNIKKYFLLTYDLYIVIFKYKYSMFILRQIIRQFIIKLIQ